MDLKQSNNSFMGPHDDYVERHDIESCHETILTWVTMCLQPSIAESTLNQQ